MTDADHNYMTAMKAEIARVGISLLEEILTSMDGTAEERRLLAVSLARKVLLAINTLEDMEGMMTWKCPQ